MKRVLKSAATFALSLLAVSPVLLTAHEASAQPTVQTKGMNGSYIGGGIAAGVTHGDDEDAKFGGNIQGRYDIPRLPISLRGSVLFSDDASAIMPILSYDYGVARNTNLYAGAGYSFVTNDGKASPLGNDDAVVLTAGVETAVHPRVVLYSDVKVGIDAYKDSGTAASLQLGAAYRF